MAATTRAPACGCRHTASVRRRRSPVKYGNLIRAPDRRTLIGKHDHALLRLMGDCGLRALTVRAIQRPHANSAHHHLFVRGKGDVEREIPIPAVTYRLRDENAIFVSLARSGTPGAMSQQALAAACASACAARLLRHDARG